MARASRQILADDPQASARFSSAEDAILSKMEWYRLGGEVSERQWGDIQGILKTKAGALDLDYLQAWAKDLQVGDLLKRALAEAG